jgi:acetyltransferase-like isoleucine patch superfamily enzyme
MRLKVKTLLSGLRLLTDRDLVQDLGERRRHLLNLRELQQRFPSAKLSRDLRIIGYETDRLLLGTGASLCEGTILACGDEINGFGQIEVGARTWIGQYNNLRACAGGDVVIGADCLLAQFCTLVGSNHALSRSQPIRGQGAEPTRRGVVLEDDVWLGAGVVVTPGVTIARGAVVGANAVVTKDVPEYEIWAGVPARRIGERTESCLPRR